MNGVDRAGGPAELAARPPDDAADAPPRRGTKAGGERFLIRSAGTVTALAAGVVAVLVAALAVGGARPAAVTGGLPQAGPLVDWGLPVAELAARIAGVGTVGFLLFAAVLRPGPGGALPAESRRAVRVASGWALAWALATVLAALLTLCELVGVPPSSLPVSALPVFLTDVAAGRAAVVAAAVAGGLAVTARRCTTAMAAGVLLAAAGAGLVAPAVLTGHSAAAANHTLAVTNLSVHVVAAALWVGGLLALVLLGRGDDDVAYAAPRFSPVALACFLATGASGLLAAWLLLGESSAGLAAAVGTGYGWLLAGKTAALASLGVLGWRHRRSTLPRLRAGEPGSFRRFAAVETVVMLATIALAVALSASPPPAADSSSSTAAQSTAPAGQPAPPPSDGETMAGHDHGELSVSVLIDETRFHVFGPVARGSLVTVHNGTTTEVTITAADGSFDVVVPGVTMLTFRAPEQPGSYRFSSRHSPSFTDVLVVR